MEMSAALAFGRDLIAGRRRPGAGGGGGGGFVSSSLSSTVSGLTIFLFFPFNFVGAAEWGEGLTAGVVDVVAVVVHCSGPFFSFPIPANSCVSSTALSFPFPLSTAGPSLGQVPVSSRTSPTASGIEPVTG